MISSINFVLQEKVLPMTHRSKALYSNNFFHGDTITGAALDDSKCFYAF
jgi:hypothetical protein